MSLRSAMRPFQSLSLPMARSHRIPMASPSFRQMAQVGLAGPSRTFNSFTPISTSTTSTFRTSTNLTTSLIKRTFGSSPKSSLRNTYFPRGSSSGGGGYGGGQGWFRNLRRRIDRIPPMSLIYGIIGANVVVFGLWQYAISSAQRFRDPSLFFFLQKNFILNEANVFSGRVWTLITSAFSHMSGTHIFVNCLGLYFVAPAAASLLGSSAFLGLYLGAGVFSSFVSLMWHRSQSHRWVGSEGASGAIYSCLAFYGAVFPSAQVLMFFVIPMPVWVAISGLFAWDFYSAIARPNSGTDSAGHLGGILFGLAAAMRIRRGQMPRWR